MAYRLKDTSPEFKEVDGPHKGFEFKQGVRYQDSDIPDGKEDLFELIDDPADEQHDDNEEGGIE